MSESHTVQVRPGLNLGISTPTKNVTSVKTAETAIVIAYVKYHSGPWTQILFQPIEMDEYLRLSSSELSCSSIREMLFDAIAKKIPDLFNVPVSLERVEFLPRYDWEKLEVVRKPKTEEVLAYG